MNRRITGVATIAIAMLAAAGPAAAQTPATKAASFPTANTTRWVVDPVHSQVEFGIRHLLGRVRGSFARWYAVIETRDRDWTHGAVNVQVRTASINTGNAYRDTDLRSPRFLSTDSFPEMTFESTNIASRDSTVQIWGTLKLKGRSHPVVLKGRFHGIGKDLEGKERIAFDASTVVDRRDYGIRWNQLLEGSNTIGDDVEITIALEAVRAN